MCAVTAPVRPHTAASVAVPARVVLAAGSPSMTAADPTAAPGAPSASWRSIMDRGDPPLCPSLEGTPPSEHDRAYRGMSVRLRVRGYRLARMYSCPCCGYKTLPGRGDYDTCPVCAWEDEGVEPWEYSDPNAQTLVEAQQAYLSETRPRRRRPARVRPPKRHEARDPHWQPYELTDELMVRVQKTNEDRRRDWDEEQRRVAEEIAADREGPLKGYNAAMRSLRAQAPAMSHREVKARMRDLGREHDFTLPDPYLELRSRLTKDEDFYRHHPAHAAWWLLRHSRPGTFRQRWQELRTGTVYFVG
jgi:hypothetical protein